MCERTGDLVGHGKLEHLHRVHAVTCRGRRSGSMFETRVKNLGNGGRDRVRHDSYATHQWIQQVATQHVRG